MCNKFKFICLPVYLLYVFIKQIFKTHSFIWCKTNEGNISQCTCLLIHSLIHWLITSSFWPSICSLIPPVTSCLFAECSIGNGDRDGKRERWRGRAKVWKRRHVMMDADASLARPPAPAVYRQTANFSFSHTALEHDPQDYVHWILYFSQRHAICDRLFSISFQLH